MITIPINQSEQSTESGCGEDEAVCYSGQALSLLIDPDGCKVNIIYFNENHPLFSLFLSP